MVVCSLSDYSTHFSLNLNTNKSNALSAGDMYFSMESAGNHLLCGDLTSPTSSWADGSWHQIVATWSTAANAVSFYIDGASTPTTYSYQQMTGSESFGLELGSSCVDRRWWRVLQRLAGRRCCVGQSAHQHPAAALYNLSRSSLNYSAVDAETLFDVYGDHSSRTTADGKTWKYATGLSGPLGAVVNGNTLILDSGDGVTLVPEPGAMALLATGLLGLLAYAWRKRKYSYDCGFVICGHAGRGDHYKAHLKCASQSEIKNHESKIHRLYPRGAFGRYCDHRHLGLAAAAGSAGGAGSGAKPAMRQ